MDKLYRAPADSHEPGDAGGLFVSRWTGAPGLMYLPLMLPKCVPASAECEAPGASRFVWRRRLVPWPSAQCGKLVKAAAFGV